jgi:hypothetical protein
MLTPTPLAERLQRRAGAAAEAWPGQVPIVHVQPQPTMAGDSTFVHSEGASEPEDRSMPIVSATLASAQPSSSNLSLTLPPHAASVASNAGTSQSMVIQRSAAPSAAASSMPSALLPLPMEGGLPQPPLTLPALGDRPATRRAHHTRTPLDQLASAVLPVVTAVRATDSTSAIKQLPLIRSISIFSGVDSTSQAVIPATSISWPLGRSQSTDRGSSADRSGVTDVPVVHEQITRERTTNLPIARSPASLPLAAVATPTSQPATERISGSERPMPALKHSLVHTPPTAAAEPTTDLGAASQQAQSEREVDQIVDKVHRKFIRQLTIEGERRGLR